MQISAESRVFLRELATHSRRSTLVKRCNDRILSYRLYSRGLRNIFCGGSRSKNHAQLLNHYLNRSDCSSNFHCHIVKNIDRRKFFGFSLELYVAVIEKTFLPFILQLISRFWLNFLKSIRSKYRLILSVPYDISYMELDIYDHLHGVGLMRSCLYLVFPFLLQFFLMKKRKRITWYIFMCASVMAGTVK